MRELLPVRNLRRVIPRMCGTCAHGTFDDGSFVCQRQNGPIFDAGDRTELLHVCDLWQNGVRGWSRSANTD